MTSLQLAGYTFHHNERFTSLQVNPKVSTLYDTHSQSILIPKKSFFWASTVHATYLRNPALCM